MYPPLNEGPPPHLPYIILTPRDINTWRKTYLLDKALTHFRAPWHLTGATLHPLSKTCRQACIPLKLELTVIVLTAQRPKLPSSISEQLSSS